MKEYDERDNQNKLDNNNQVEETGKKSDSTKKKFVVKNTSKFSPEIAEHYKKILLKNPNFYIPGFSNKKNLSPEEQLKKDNDYYYEQLGKSIDTAKNPYQTLISIYGPDGTVPENCPGDENYKNEYKDLKIDTTGTDLDEKLVTAIILGSCLNAKRLDKDLTESTNRDFKEGAQVAFNRCFIIENITKGDNRSKNFIPVMVEAKKDAIKAINAYKKGDKSLVNEYLNNIMDYSENNAYSHNTLGSANSNSLNNSRKFFLFASDLKKDQRVQGFRRKLNPEEKVFSTLNDAYITELNLIDKSNNLKKQLIDDDTFFNKNDEDKEEILLNILLYDYASSTSTNRIENANELTSKYTSDYCRNLGINEETPGTGIEYPNLEMEIQRNKNIEAAKQTYFDNILKHKVSKVSELLAKPNGIAELKNLYGNELKNTEIFKTLKASKNKNELIKNLSDIKKFRNKGLEQFTNVDLSKVESNIAGAAETAYNYSLKETNKTIENTIINTYYKDDLETNSIKSFDKNGLKQNATFIKKMVSDIASVNRFTSGANFKKMRDELVELSKYADKLANIDGNINLKNIVTYNEKIQSVSNLALKYLENKTDINSNYAKRRVEAVGKLRRNLLEHTWTIDNARNAQIEKYKESSKKYMNKTLYKYSASSPEYQKVFRGDYESKDLTGSKFMIGRVSGVSIATFALLNEGYSFDEVTDPNLIPEKKREMFDTVVRKAKSQKPADMKWFAEVMYNGFEKYDEIMNEEFKKLDLKDPKVTSTERFAKLSNLAYLNFDVWQEMGRISDEITEIAKKKMPDTINSYDGFFCMP